MVQNGNFIDNLPFGDVAVIKDHLEREFVNNGRLGQPNKDLEVGQLDSKHFEKWWLFEFDMAMKKYERALLRASPQGEAPAT